MTTGTETTNFLGIPVVGKIIHGEVKANQRPLEELTPLIQAVLDDPNVKAFGWTQYTPYFNDGEPCIFSVNALWADPVTLPNQFLDVDEDEEDYESYRADGFEWDSRWGEVNWGPWEGTYPRARKRLGYTGDYPETYPKLEALDEALQSEAFDDALLTAFGDHAEIAVTREKILVQEYSHD